METSTSLYIVPTPIGNLEDITLRAIRVLKEVDIVLAEDTRTSKKLFSHYQIETPLQSYHAFNEHKVLDSLIKRMKQGEKMALITDAGTPAVSDPGFLLVREGIAENLKLECLPGATAFLPALVKSGLPAEKFIFEGFLPHKKGRQTRLKLLSQETRTFILYESPHRLLKTLQQLSDYLGTERKISVSRELTKYFEETVNGSIAQVQNHFESKEIKGEIVIVVDGAKL